MKDNTLTIAFTTIGRYESAKNLLTSIKDTVKVPHSILIVNSGSDLDLDFKSRYTEDFEVINYDKPLRVPKARNIRSKIKIDHQPQEGLVNIFITVLFILEYLSASAI